MTPVTAGAGKNLKNATGNNRDKKTVRLMVFGGLLAFDAQGGQGENLQALDADHFFAALANPVGFFFDFDQRVVNQF